MKLTTSHVWKSGVVALGVLSIVGLHSAGAQTATTTPSSGNSAVTTTGNGTDTGSGNGTNAANGADTDNDKGAANDKGNWNDGGMPGRGGHMTGGPGMMGGAGFGRHARMMGIAGVDAQTVADYLGLTVEQLKANLDAGQSLSQIAVAQGKTRDDLRAFLVEKATAAIDASLDATVTAGKSNAGNAAGGNAIPSVSATPTT